MKYCTETFKNINFCNILPIYTEIRLFYHQINHILVEIIVHVHNHRKFYSLVYTNSNESGFRRIFVFGTRFSYLHSIVTLMYITGVNEKLDCQLSFGYELHVMSYNNG